MCFCAWTIWYIYIYCLSCQEILVLAESSGISNRVKFNIHIPLPTVLYAYTILSHPKESPISGAVYYKCQHDVPWNPSWWSIYFIGFLDSYHTYLQGIIFHHILHLSIHGYDTFPIIRYPSMDRSINIMISIPPPPNNKHIHFGKRKIINSKVPAIRRGYVIVPRICWTFGWCGLGMAPSQDAQLPPRLLKSSEGDSTPKQSMYGTVYLPPFTIKINQMLVNIPYMDPMGHPNGYQLQVSTSLFFSTSLGCKAISSWLNANKIENLEIGWIYKNKTKKTHQSRQLALISKPELRAFWWDSFTQPYQFSTFWSDQGCNCYNLSRIILPHLRYDVISGS